MGQIMGGNVAVEPQAQFAPPPPPLVGGQGQGAFLMIFHALVMHGRNPPLVQNGRRFRQGRVYFRSSRVGDDLANGVDS